MQHQILQLFKFVISQKKTTGATGPVPYHRINTAQERSTDKTMNIESDMMKKNPTKMNTILADAFKEKVTDVAITSEIAPLKSVLLKRPGQELNNLTPAVLDRLLFDDIPFLENAQKEHDDFSETLKKGKTQVFYLEDLVGDILKDSANSLDFIRRFLRLSNIHNPKLIAALSDYLSTLSGTALCQKLMSGLKKSEFRYHDKSLSGQVTSSDDFWLEPIPNLYFTRDPAAIVGNLVLLNRMFAKTRRRESLFIEHVFKYHSLFKHNKLLSAEHFPDAIEGGDLLVLDRHTLAIGISQRTSAKAIESLCHALFFDESLKPHHEINKVLAFNIPSSRAFMHLDTVLTQVDNCKFTIHQGIVGHTNIYRLTPDDHNHIKCRKLSNSIENSLSAELDKAVEIIYCGGYDSINGSREQWSDGANTLAVTPGEVLVYERNCMTNKILEDHGVIVHKMPCSELSRGRGGPRCMSMPLVRSSHQA